MPEDYKDPALQTGPYPAWPTLPSMQQPKPHYLENDPTPWQGGDFPTHVSPLSIMMALLGARATGAKAVPAGQPRTSSGVALSRNMYNPAEDPEMFHYNIYNDLKPVGEAHGTVQGPAAYVNWIGNQGEGPQMALGTPAMRQLITQFQQDFPQVEQLQGWRVSGARYKPGQASPEQIVKILKGQP